MKVDRLITDCRLATMVPGGEPYGAIEDGAMLIRDGQIVWVGPRADLPEHEAAHTDRLDGRWVTPGLIDCHTHLVFAGDRSAEYERRLTGVPYAQIAREGGGIASTVRATRAADAATLTTHALDRLKALTASGVTTVEIKSGYGLDADSELRMLRVARGLEQAGKARVRTTFLGLHAIPPEYADRRAAYVDLMVDQVLPAADAEGLVDAVDAYLEPIAFTGEEVSRLFDKARALGLPVKLHADQLGDGGGAALAARHRALSADHVEYISDEGVQAMAEAGVVAVLLPGAFVMLDETQLPPVQAFRDAGVAMAVATDCNPGTSPMASLTLGMALACMKFRLTPEEALGGTTRHAARALGIADQVGTLETGKAADLAVWDINGPGELSYWLGKPLLHRRYLGGRPATQD